MAQEIPAESIDLESRSFGGAQTRLSRWLVFSFLFHLLLIMGLFFSPWAPTRAVPSYLVYSVDLVGGEKIGGTSLGTELAPAAAVTKAAPKAESTAAVAESKAKVERSEKEKKDISAKPEKRKTVQPQSVVREAVTPKAAEKKAPAKKEPTTQAQAESAADPASLESVRERIMQSAAERAKSRNDNAQKASKGEAFSLGTGEGVGASALGQGGRGGPGIIKGMDYVIYQNRMLSTIKNNWVWAGLRSNIKVVVHFNIKDSGEIVGLKLVQSSGNPSYDDSVLRAVRKSSPLPPLAENIRGGFSEVELAFRPEDLDA